VRLLVTLVAGISRIGAQRYVFWKTPTSCEQL